MVDVIGHSSSIFGEDSLNMNDLNKASSLERSQESKYGSYKSSEHRYMILRLWLNAFPLALNVLYHQQVSPVFDEQRPGLL